MLFENSSKKLIAFLCKIKAKLMEFKSNHQRDGDGIETKLFAVLKVKYCVAIQAYHGGTMHGKDIQKVMENVTTIFEEFAEILKANSRVDCKLSNDDIDKFCGRFSHLCMLWDGAFSHASN